MATIPQHIYKLRTFIKQHTDDSIYSDEFLYSLLKDGRNTMIERDVKKFSKDAEAHKQSICMPLEVSTFHDCSCLPKDTKCKILKSKFKLPAPIMGRNRESLEVMNIEGFEQYGFTVSIMIKNEKYTRTKKNKIRWTLFDNYIIVFNTLKLGVILVQGIFEDPVELASITFCNNSGDDETCYNISEDEFPIKGSLDIPMYQYVLEILKVPLKLKEDETNNANSQQ